MTEAIHTVIRQPTGAATVSASGNPTQSGAGVTLTLLSTGIRGERGTQGPQGPAGVVAQYTHAQPAPSDVWVVNHNLGARPQVSVLSVGGKELMAEVIHSNENQALIYFDQPTAGTAICT